MNNTIKYQLWETFTLFLSIYVLIEMSIEIIMPFPEYLQQVFDNIDLIICFIFLGDFFFFFVKADNKWKFLKSHWLDFISSIPFASILRFMRIARIFRFIRVIKLLRGAKGILPLIRWLTKNKLRSALITYSFIFLIVWFYSSLAFYSCEKGVNPNVHEYFDAIWWAFTTVTSVGYGDIAPITKLGRIVAMVLVLSGMGLFSLITAELSANFITIIKKDNASKDPNQNK